MYYNVPILLKLSEKDCSNDKHLNFILVRIFTFIEGIGNLLHACKYYKTGSISSVTLHMKKRVH